VGFKSNAGRCRSSAFFVRGSLAGVNSAHEPQTKNAALRAAFDLAERTGKISSLLVEDLRLLYRVIVKKNCNSGLFQKN